MAASQRSGFGFAVGIRPRSSHKAVDLRASAARIMTASAPPLRAALMLVNLLLLLARDRLPQQPVAARFAGARTTDEQHRPARLQRRIEREAAPDKTHGRYEALRQRATIKVLLVWRRLGGRLGRVV